MREQLAGRVGGAAARVRGRTSTSGCSENGQVVVDADAVGDLLEVGDVPAARCLPLLNHLRRTSPVRFSTVQFRSPYSIAANVASSSVLNRHECLELLEDKREQRLVGAPGGRLERAHRVVHLEL